MPCKYLYFIFCFIVSFALPNNAAPHPVDTTDISGNLSITIASEPDYPPYCFISEGKPEGFSVDLFMAAAKAANLDVSLQIGVWNRIKQDLAEGRIDALPLVGRTPEREEVFDFTMPYLLLHGAVFMRKGDRKIQSLDELAEKEIIVMLGDNAEEFIRRHNISERIITTRTFEEAFIKLATGEGDAIITQKIMGLHLLKELKIKTIHPLDIPMPAFRQDFCFAVKKGNSELLTRLNEGLSVIIANKTFDRIHMKWFGPKPGDNLDYKETLSLMIYILVPTLLILFGISIVFLRREVHRRTKKLQNEIADHKRTVNSLRRQQLLLSEMERITKVGGWEYEIGDAIISWTNGVYEIYGVEKHDFDPLNMKRFLEFYHPDDREIIRVALKELASRGESFDLELRFTAADGSAKWVRSAGQAEFSDGKVIRVYGNIMDITVQKHSENDLRKLKHELEILVAKRTMELEEKVQRLDRSEKAMLYMVEDLNNMAVEIKREHRKLEVTNRELEAFSYSVSHDLRAPLRAMDGFAKILKEGYDKILDEEGKRLIDIIIHNAKQMGLLIEDLLSFSRISRQELKLSNIDMKEMVLSVFHEIATQKDIQEITLKLHEIPEAFGDATMLHQLWVNLIGNAIKFTTGKHERTIEINSIADENENIYYIKDNGAGFDMAYSKKLFGVFQRLHSDKEFEGTGVGLAIVQRIVLRMNGRVWAEGQINLGATFYFTLPRKN